MSENVILDEHGLRRCLNRIAHEIIEQNPGDIPIGFIGLHTRGVPIAKRLRDLVSKFDPQRTVHEVGELDITFHRDDIQEELVLPKGTEIPFNIEDQIVVLVDDVLYTGRTVRAALNAMIDLGRTKAIRLAILVDRGHRELPIRADYVGKNIPTAHNERILVQLEEIDGKDNVLLERTEL
ncbi:MAG: bifunctional pyr operon transcriptional regulator/uracil phosphoribosyltransferase PyrR [Verrucomicrobiota bacterium]